MIHSELNKRTRDSQGCFVLYDLCVQDQNSPHLSIDAIPKETLHFKKRTRQKVLAIKFLMIKNKSEPILL